MKHTDEAMNEAKPARIDPIILTSRLKCSMIQPCDDLLQVIGIPSRENYSDRKKGLHYFKGKLAYRVDRTTAAIMLNWCPFCGGKQ